MDRLNKVLNMARRIPESRSFSVLLFLCASAITYHQKEVEGAIFFLIIICAELLLCENISVALSPFLMVCVFICTCYDSFRVFIVYLPIAIVAVMCVAFNFLVYKRKYSIGPSFFPLCLTAAAITLGGLGTIPKEDYFAPGALFYTFGLGAGMLLVYILFRGVFLSDDGEAQNKLKERFSFDMYLMGFTTVVCILSFYLREIDTFLEAPRLINFQAQNNFSTFLMFAMPFSLYFTMNTAAKTDGNSIIRFSDIHLCSFVLMYLAILLTDSRGGLVFGTVEFFICAVYAIYNRGGRRRYFYAVVSVFLLIGMYFGGRIMLEHLRNTYPYGIASAGESRGGLVLRAIDDFIRNPIFGSGFGYQGNSDLYSPVQGAMNWYHMYVAQIIGSFGIVGIVAFGNMVLHRFSLFLREPNTFKLTLGLSYIGVLLMSMVNPGEFCPIPYELMTVLIFILLESDFKKTAAF